MTQEERERQWEEDHLREVETFLEGNVERLTRQKWEVDAETKDLYDHFKSDNPEIYNALLVSLDRQEQIGNVLRKNRTALEKPYFGRIDYEDSETRVEETLYIGKNGITREDAQVLIVDWRAPVSSVYYDCSLGTGSYHSVEDLVIPIDLKLKRTFDIENRKLLGFYDSDAVSNDELLIRYLSKNKEAVLKDIITTIQQEQNVIIRERPACNILVQGVAGSGKTTVAMHRISYLLYNYEKLYKPQQICILGSSAMLLDYITSGLPDLDVSHTKQMQIRDFFLEVLERDVSAKRLKYLEEPMSAGAAKSKLAFFRALERFASGIQEETVPLEPLEESYGTVLAPQYILQTLTTHGEKSLPEKLELLDDRLRARLKLLLGSEDREVLRAEERKYKNYFKKRLPKRSVQQYYLLFLETVARDLAAWGLEGLCTPEDLEETARLARGTRLDVYDLMAMAYLRVRLRDSRLEDDLRLVVVDEAQDFGAVVYAVLKVILRRAKFTIMGDVSQNIHYDTGMNDWDDLRERVFCGADDVYHVLAKSYRNTIEISQYAARVLRRIRREDFRMEPILRHGEPVEVKREPDEEHMVEDTVRLVEDIRSKGHDTIAVICRTQEEADHVSGLLGGRVPLEGGRTFHQGLMVLPIHLTKGLEFDGVVLWNPDGERYRDCDADAKLLYVAMTRALHELHLLHQGELTPLLGEE